MTFDWNNLQKPIVGLSPMADMTDSPFCRIVKSFASPIIFREMVSAEAIVRGNKKTIEMADIHETERPLIQQIFGAESKSMAEAAKIIEEIHKPEGIDINMGCPVYKMTSNFNGCALMKDPELAVEIVKKIKKAVSVPVSVKMRAGWSKHTDCIEFSKRIEDAGADLISVHGRTKEQAYTGVANREVITQVKQSVNIPVLYNGDIFTWQDYFKALEETNCDGALIARGGLGNPWIFKQIEEKLAGKTPSEPSLEEKIKTALAHLDLHLAQYGEDKISTFRKHLSWYFKGQPDFKKYKMKLMTTIDKNEIREILLSTLDK